MPGVRGGSAQAGGDRDRGDHGIRGEVVDDAALPPGAQEGFEEDRQAGAGGGGHRVGGLLQCADGGGVLPVHPDEELGGIEAVAHHPADIVAGETVVHFEDRAAQAAAVHGADGDSVVEDAEEGEVFDDVGGAEHAVHTGTGQGEGEPLQQVEAVGHRELIAADAAGAAGGVVGRDDEEAAVSTHQRTAGSRGEGRRDAVRPALADLAEAGERIGADERRRAADRVSMWTWASSSRMPSTSAVVGIAVEHSRRVATIAPATLAKRSTRSSGHS